MAERSRFWDGIVTGDASVAPYDAATEFSEVMMALSDTYSETDKGEIVGPLTTGLTPSIPVAGTLRLAAGQAIVYGTWYEATAVVDTVIPTPSVSTRIDRIVLRKSWAAQTVRVTRIAGAEGGAAPAMVQIAGTTWDFPICQVSTTTGGVNTITDQRSQGMWYRTGATAIRTDAINIGVGIAPPAWPTGWAEVYAGLIGLYGSTTSGNSSGISANSYFDGTNNRAIVAGPAVQLSTASGQLAVIMMASVGAGAVQATTTYFTVATDGLVTVPGSLSITGNGAQSTLLNLSATMVGGSINLIGLNFGNLTFSTAATSSARGIYLGLTTAAGAYTTNSVNGIYLAGVLKGAGNTITYLAQLAIELPTVGTNNTCINFRGVQPTGNTLMYDQPTGANFSTTGVFNSVSHEFNDDGSAFKLRRGLLRDRFDVVRAIRSLDIHAYAYAEDAKGQEFAAPFAEELHAISPLLSDGKTVAFGPTALALAAIQVLLEEIDALKRERAN